MSPPVAASAPAPGTATARHASVTPAGIDAAYGIRASYHACMRTTPRVQDREDCASAEAGHQVARLQAAYAGLHAAAGQAAGAVAASQRAWEATRDADCRVETALAGSALGPVALADCEMRESARRAARLEDWRSAL